MNLWRYRAVLMNEPGVTRSGELAAETPADLRATLRRAGLQVIQIKRVRKHQPSHGQFLKSFVERWHKHLRTRRCASRAELYDNIATMIESGLPLTDAIETLLESRSNNRSALSTLLSDFRGKLRDGAPLSDAMTFRGDWFEPPEVAMVQAAQQSGELANVLRSLAARHQRAEAISQKLIGALAYPAVVSVIAFAVVIFMSTRTLPQLAALLIDNDIPVPGLTRVVMGFGQWLAGHWFLLLASIVVGPAIISGVSTYTRKRIYGRRANATANSGARSNYWTLSGFRPPYVLKQIVVGSFCAQLAELLRAGIPLVESLQIVAPTIKRHSFRSHVLHAAQSIEHGSDPAEAMAHKVWLDAEFTRLVEVGQNTGELDAMLRKLADRYQRSAERSIERLTRLLEPLVIVALAAIVGVVVMAAVLPLVRLQEII